MSSRYTDSHTFVVCAYRESPYLEACIQSLLRQSVRSRIRIATSTPNEHIAGLAKKYRLPLCVREPGEQKGIAEDWNFALSCADTPFVTLAHQDDVYRKQYTEKILEAAEQCRHPLILFTDYYELREEATVKSNRLLKVKRLLLSPLRIHGFWTSRFVRRRILSMGSAICCPSVTLARENIPLPVFENNMKSNIDWQAWERLSRLDGEFAYVDRPLMKHRIHVASTTSGLLKENGRKQEDLLMYRRFWPGWIAAVIEHFYQTSEQSNEL